MSVPTLDVELFDTPAGARARLTMEGQAPLEHPFSLSTTGSTASLLRALELGRCQRDDLSELGTQLFAALMGDSGTTLLEGALADSRATGPALRIRLDLTAQGARLPWEALYDLAGAGFLASDDRLSIERTLRRPAKAVKAPRDLDGARVLVVIPEGADLSVASELGNMTYAVAEAAAHIKLTPLDGSVTPNRLDAALKAERYDIVHFIGHGTVDDNGDASIRLNKEGAPRQDEWLSGEAFAALFARRGVELVVLNCCFGGYPPESRVMAGIGPFLLRAGVSAVVAMRYEIADKLAVRFSRSLYRELFTGDAAGQVDVAVARARRDLFLNQGGDVRAFVTPILFASGPTQLFLVKSRAPEAAPPSSTVGRRAPKLTLTPKLLAALRGGRCVPVVGPGLASNEAVRSGGVAPMDKKKLARLLGEEAKYPNLAEIDFAEKAGEFLEDMVLQRVCQHYAQALDRWCLVEAIRRAFPTVQIPEALLRLASWPVPGLFYTAVDGLLEAAFGAARRPVASLSGVDDNASEPGVGVPLLVHLRGSPSDHRSLVLTMDDHDQLAERIHDATDDVTGLVSSRPGRALLFLGASPQDSALKQLVLELVPPTVRENMGGLFFVAPSPSAIDKARWARFNVEWIDEDPADVVIALDEALAVGARP